LFIGRKVGNLSSTKPRFKRTRQPSREGDDHVKYQAEAPFSSQKPNNRLKKGQALNGKEGGNEEKSEEEKRSFVGSGRGAEAGGVCVRRKKSCPKKEKENPRVSEIFN